MNILQNLRLRTQVMILFAVMFILASIIIYLCQFINVMILRNIIFDESNKVLSIQNRNIIQLEDHFYALRFKEIINLYYLKSKNLQKIYQFLQQSDYIGDIPFSCGQKQSYSLSPSITCMKITGYDINNYTQQQQLLDFYFQFGSLMHQSMMIIDDSYFITANLQMVPLNQSILYQWPAVQFPLAFNPHVRPPFLNHMAHINSRDELILSDIYKTISNTFQVALTSNLSDQNKQLQGITYILLDFLGFKKHFPENMIVINKLGKLVFSWLNYSSNTSSAYFIWNESITGFNQQDWNEMQLGISNCTLKIASLCRYNSLFNQDVLIVLKNLNVPPLTILIYLNTTDVQETLNQQYILISNLNQENNEIIGWSLIISIMIIVPFDIFLIQRILKPLNILTIYTQQIIMEEVQLKKIQKQRKSTLQNSESSGILGQLLTSTRKILAFQKGYFKKSYQCRIHERFAYPYAEKRITEFDIKKLDDNQGSPRALIVKTLLQNFYNYEN